MNIVITYNYYILLLKIMNKLSHRIFQLAELENGWYDNYQGTPPSLQTCDICNDIALEISQFIDEKLLCVFPLISGGLTIEFDLPHVGFVICFDESKDKLTIELEIEYNTIFLFYTYIIDDDVKANNIIDFILQMIKTP